MSGQMLLPPGHIHIIKGVPRSGDRVTLADPAHQWMAKGNVWPEAASPVITADFQRLGKPDLWRSAVWRVGFHLEWAFLHETYPKPGVLWPQLYLKVTIHIRAKSLKAADIVGTFVPI